MTGYMLDTDISSYFLKGKNRPLQEKIRTAMRQKEVAISVITRAELLFGLEFLPPEHSVHALVRSFLQNIPVLPWGNPAADCFARLSADQQKRGKLIGIMDTQIAAHALTENRILVTNNTRHYGRIEGLLLENWYQDN